MKYTDGVISVAICLLVITNTQFGYAQIIPDEDQKQEIIETCVLAPYVDPVVYLQVLNESKTSLTQEEQYHKDCIEIMVNAYQNNESHDEMMNKLSDLWLDTYT